MSFRCRSRRRGAGRAAVWRCAGEAAPAALSAAKAGARSLYSGWIVIDGRALRPVGPLAPATSKSGNGA